LDFPRNLEERPSQPARGVVIDVVGGGGFVVGRMPS
jgi:hypothetical protein